MFFSGTHSVAGSPDRSLRREQLFFLWRRGLQDRGRPAWGWVPPDPRTGAAWTWPALRDLGSATRAAFQISWEGPGPLGLALLNCFLFLPKSAAQGPGFDLPRVQVVDGTQTHVLSHRAGPLLQAPSGCEGVGTGQFSPQAASGPWCGGFPWKLHHEPSQPVPELPHASLMKALAQVAWTRRFQF